jgi:hypothetical protein
MRAVFCMTRKLAPVACVPCGFGFVESYLIYSAPATDDRTAILRLLQCCETAGAQHHVDLRQLRTSRGLSAALGQRAPPRLQTFVNPRRSLALRARSSRAARSARHW